MSFRWVPEWKAWVQDDVLVRLVNPRENAFERVVGNLKKLAGPMEPAKEWKTPHWLTCENVHCTECWNRQVHTEHAREMLAMKMHPLG